MKKPIYEVFITGYLKDKTVEVSCTCFSRNAVVNFIDQQLGMVLPKNVEIDIKRIDPCATIPSK